MLLQKPLKLSNMPRLFNVKKSKRYFIVFSTIISDWISIHRNIDNTNTKTYISPDYTLKDDIYKK